MGFAHLGAWADVRRTPVHPSRCLVSRHSVVPAKLAPKVYQAGLSKFAFVCMTAANPGSGQKGSVGEKGKSVVWKDLSVSTPEAEGVSAVLISGNMQTSVPAVIHFIPGFGLTPANYKNFLERLCEATNCIIVATSGPVSTKHDTLAQRHVAAFQECHTDYVTTLLCRQPESFVPVLGMGHSLGAKLLALAACDGERQVQGPPRVASILMSYNNFPVSKSIPLYANIVDGMRALNVSDQLASVLQRFASLGLMNDADMMNRVAYVSGLLPKNFRTIVQNVASAVSFLEQGDEFTPTPDAVEQAIRSTYNQPNTLIIKFGNDQIDQSERLKMMVESRFPREPELARILFRALGGTHLTPCTPPLDAGAATVTAENVMGSARQPWVSENVGKAVQLLEAQLEALVTTCSAYILLQQEVALKMVQAKSLPP